MGGSPGDVSGGMKCVVGGKNLRNRWGRCRGREGGRLHLIEL